MMTTATLTMAAITRQVVVAVGCAAAALGMTLAATAGHDNSSQQRIVAQCTDVDTEDSFSMSCVPSIIPDTSDQLTEQEVAEPGFNGNDHGGESGPAGPGAPGGGGGGGGHGGR